MADVSHLAMAINLNSRLPRMIDAMTLEVTPGHCVRVDDIITIAGKAGQGCVTDVGLNKITLEWTHG